MSDTLPMFWLPGTGLVLHRIWLWWRARGAQQEIHQWVASGALPMKLPPDQVVTLMFELRGLSSNVERAEDAEHT